MAKTSTRIVGPQLLSNAPATIYTAAAKVIIRRMNVDNPTAGPVGFTFSIGADAAGTRLFSGVQIPAGQGLDWYGPWTIENGQILQAYGSEDAVLNITINADVVT